MNNDNMKRKNKIKRYNQPVIDSNKETFGKRLHGKRKCDLNGHLFSSKFLWQLHYCVGLAICDQGLCRLVELQLFGLPYQPN